MNSNAVFKSTFRILMLPFSLLYGAAVFVRNRLFDLKIIRSATFNFPLICVGNLAVGGTGKSPMVEYLVSLLKEKYQVATLSRGYKRKTKGYALANASTTALEIGDEPMQFHTKFPDVPVAVGEERIVAIPQLLHDKPETDVIILDDAFQHRYVKAGLNILLSDYSNPFYNDWFLPSGDLRDERRSYQRAQIIIITKCPPQLSQEEKTNIAERVTLTRSQQLFFTSVAYGEAYHILTNITTPVAAKQVLMVCGIANPQPLRTFLKDQAGLYEELVYSDHHIFTIDDLKKIRAKWNTMAGENKIIITTEKDAVRLHKFEEELTGLPLYVLPVKPRFLFGESEQFDNTVMQFVEAFK